MCNVVRENYYAIYLKPDPYNNNQQDALFTFNNSPLHVSSRLTAHHLDVKCKVHTYTGTEALYRLYGP